MHGMKLPSQGSGAPSVYGNLAASESAPGEFMHIPPAEGEGVSEACVHSSAVLSSLVPILSLHLSSSFVGLVLVVFANSLPSKSRCVHDFGHFLLASLLEEEIRHTTLVASAKPNACGMAPAGAAAHKIPSTLPLKLFLGDAVPLARLLIASPTSWPK